MSALTRSGYQIDSRRRLALDGTPDPTRRCRRSKRRSNDDPSIESSSSPRAGISWCHALRLQNAVKRQHMAIFHAGRMHDEFGVGFLQQRLASLGAADVLAVDPGIELATSSSLEIEASDAAPMPLMMTRFMFGSVPRRQRPQCDSMRRDPAPDLPKKTRIQKDTRHVPCERFSALLDGKQRCALPHAA